MDLSTELGKSYSREWFGKKFAKAGVKIRGSPEWVEKKFAKAGVKIRGSLDWVEKKFAEAGVKIRGSLDWFAKAGVKIPGALDWVEKKFAEAGVKIREVLLDRVSLLLLSVISSIAVLVCLLQTKNMASQKKLWILVGFFFYIGLGLGFHRILNKGVTHFCLACSKRYPNLYIIVRCIGILLVLLGFVYLTKFIEKHEGWNGYENSPNSLMMNNGGTLSCMIDYEASSKRMMVRFRNSGSIKLFDPFFSFSVDLAKLWKDGEVTVGLSSANGNTSKPHFLHSWSFEIRHPPPMWMHSEPLEPNEVSKEEEDGRGTSECIWKMLGALVFGAACGALGTMLALYIWTLCRVRQSMAVVPEECAIEQGKK